MKCFASVVSAAAVALVGCGGGKADAEQRVRREQQTKAADEEIDPKSLVKLRLVADATAFTPGGELTLAAVFEIKDGWHIYWINPGDSGLKTTAAFTGPAGFAVEAARFPGPIEFRSPGDIVSYGWEHATVAFGTVKAPADPPASATFKVKGTWLACAEVCVPGKAEAEVTVARGDAKPANEDLLAKHRERLPRPLSALSGASSAKSTVRVPGADVAYFPVAGDAVKPVRAGDATKLTLPSGARGVLRVGARYYDVP